MVDGLVVLVFDKDEGEVVFANLVGTIDLAKIGDLDGTLDIPGLDASATSMRSSTTRPRRLHRRSRAMARAASRLEE
jgi:hypothetical protein